MGSVVPEPAVSAASLILWVMAAAFVAAGGVCFVVVAVRLRRDRRRGV